MTMFIISFITAIALSGVAAYFSVTGLMAIFSAAPIPIAVMGGTLEVAKLVAASWVYKNWSIAPASIKYYFTASVVILSLITSIGIFGYLSKAHEDQNLVSGDAMARVAIFDEKIKISKDNIDANRNALKQMDEAVDQVMGRSSDEKGADKAVQIRRTQQKERVRLQSEIQAEQKTITALGEEAAPLRAEFRKIEAEVGPIKYLAALLYGDNPDTNLLERAVRWVIITIVIVFDPMAILLLIAANFTFKQYRGEMITAVNRPKGNSISAFDDPLTPIEPGPSKSEPVPVQEVNKETWSPEMYKRVKSEIPREILDKIFKK